MATQQTVRVDPQAWAPAVPVVVPVAVPIILATVIVPSGDKRKIIILVTPQMRTLRVNLAGESRCTKSIRSSAASTAWTTERHEQHDSVIDTASSVRYSFVVELQNQDLKSYKRVRKKLLLAIRHDDESTWDFPIGEIEQLHRYYI